MARVQGFSSAAAGAGLLGLRLSPRLGLGADARGADTGERALLLHDAGLRTGDYPARDGSPLRPGPLRSSVLAILPAR